MAAKKRLGRGLNALIQEQPVSPKPDVKEAGKSAETGIQRVPLSAIVVSPWQPRKEFDSDALEELVQSVKEHGVLQPLLVRDVDGTYELIAGERRFRASTEAKLKDVPVIVMDVTDKEALELALIENLQREDLNVIEEAKGYALLAEKFSLTQEQIAERVGKGRPTIANAVRLLDLPESVQRLVAEKELSAGHAKVLLGLEIDQEKILLAERVVKEGLSVRALEAIIKKLRQPARSTTVTAGTQDIPGDHLRHINDALYQLLGTSVRIKSSRSLADGKKSKGSIEIDYYSSDDLERILSVMGYAEESL